jgi:hypothetical protein
LNEAFGLAVGLRAIGSGEEMFDGKLAAGGGEVAGAVGRTAIGQEALDGDAMSFEESDGLVESMENALDLFIWQEAGESEAGVVVDGDVETFDPGSRIANGAIAGGTDAGTREAAQFLDVEVKEFTGMGALVALDGRLGEIESGEAMEAVASQNARDGSFGRMENGKDLSVGTALSAQGEDMSFEPGVGLARLTPRDRGTILELGGKALSASAREPAADGAFADVVGCGHLAQRETGGVKMGDHFGSHSGSESGISVHVVRAGWLGVEF